MVKTYNCLYSISIITVAINLYCANVLNVDSAKISRRLTEAPVRQDTTKEQSHANTPTTISIPRRRSREFLTQNPPWVMCCLMQAHNLLSRNTNDIRRNNNQAQVNDGTSSVGRPSLIISREQVEYLMDCNFTVKEMSDILGVSKRTVERRMSQ